jgi:ribonuclease HI
MPYYAVANGRETGVFINWFECKKNIDKFQGARYKKFETELDALNFIQDYKNKIINKNEIINNKDINDEVNEDIIYIFTDGACNNNGKKYAEASIGIYFGENDSRNVSEKIEGKQTNNTAELKAVIKAIYIILDTIEKNNKICICTDSEYVIKCATTYGEKVEIKENKRPPPNLELIKELYNLFKNNNNIHLKYVKAHTENEDFYSIGNKNADLLANMAIGLNNCPYNNNNNKRIYLNVKYENKDEAKLLGAKWCPKNKKWYFIETKISEDNKNKLLEKFT